ncbi:hypothetical protein A3Q56_04218, partial [Intoshia linei]
MPEKRINSTTGLRKVSESHRLTLIFVEDDSENIQTFNCPTNLKNIEKRKYSINKDSKETVFTSQNYWKMPPAAAVPERVADLNIQNEIVRDLLSEVSKEKLMKVSPEADLKIDITRLGRRILKWTSARKFCNFLVSQYHKGGMDREMLKDSSEVLRTSSLLCYSLDSQGLK